MNLILPSYWLLAVRAIRGKRHSRETPPRFVEAGKNVESEKIEQTGRRTSVREKSIVFCCVRVEAVVNVNYEGRDLFFRSVSTILVKSILHGERKTI